jgi:hypothetical protein
MYNESEEGKMEQHKKKYNTKLTGYTSEEKKLIQNFRKCSRREREILAVIVAKTAMKMTDLDDLSDLIRKA